MNITVIGSGYVGLVTGTCLADKGNSVLCVDVDEKKITMMKNGVIPIYEPGLEVLFSKNISEKRLSFTKSLKEGVLWSDVIFLALPTPPNEDGSADLSYVLKVSDEISRQMESYKIIVNKSTVPPGTYNKVKECIEKNTKVDFDVVSNPEFLREGFAVQDFMKPDRVIIGSSSEKATIVLRELYEPFVRQGNSIIIMDEVSAEVTKYAANSFLATKISFMNEMANFCEKVGANIDSIRLGIGTDERIGKRFLFSGIGYGGSCFPKDVKALIKTAREHDYRLSILESVEEVNYEQKKIITNKIIKYFNGDISGRVFALWGLAFKADTDDVREAPALEIINTLTSLSANVVVFDPKAMENASKLILNNKRVEFRKDQYSVLEGADALVIATDWSEFQSPDFKKLKKSLNNIFDGRNLYSPIKMKELGFHYESIGRDIING